MKRHPRGYVVKLVRDRVASVLGGDGTIEYRQLPRGEHVKRLRMKLIEEAAEYAVDPSLEELAQVLEVVHALAAVDLRVSGTELELALAAAMQERGGFFDGIGMYATHPWDHEDDAAVPAA